MIIKTILNIPVFQKQVIFINKTNSIKFITILTDNNKELKKVILFKYKICYLKKKVKILIEINDIDKVVFFTYYR